MNELMLEPAMPGVLSVSALARNVRDLLEHRYPLLWVSGEISNFMRARSGHSYFVLKDEHAQVRCVMFRNRSQYMNWQPADGMQVEVQALVTLYEARGEFQLGVEVMRRAGLGALYERFLKLRDRLEREGLFLETEKRALPEFPRTIGVVTSLKAAALRDVLSTLARRNPALAVVVYPVQVQGEGASAQIAAALATAGRRAECDVIILARGGGSIEDLWAFNEEAVARAIRACPIPVVCGVGHETDITIADLAADRRAPTPTAAAELVSNDRSATVQRVALHAHRIGQRMTRMLESRMQQLDLLAGRLEHPRHRLELQQERLARLHDGLVSAVGSMVNQYGWRLARTVSRMQAQIPRPAAERARLSQFVERMMIATGARMSASASRAAALSANLAHLSPEHVLARGYSVVRDQSGRIVQRAENIAKGELLDIRFSYGAARARVEDKS
jgi:exodeoxyribonuclease VII large subunit